MARSSRRATTCSTSIGSTGCAPTRCSATSGGGRCAGGRADRGGWLRSSPFRSRLPPRWCCSGCRRRSRPPTWQLARPCGPRWSSPCSDPGRSNEDQLVLWMGGVHLGALRVDVDVDLAAHAEAVRQIDPRLDRETHARYERARVFRLEVVDVRPGAMQVAIHRMARAVHELVEVSGLA